VSTAPDPLSRREGRSPFRAIGPFLALYFLTRVATLSVLPIFLDEAVHLQWAERLYSEGRILRPIGAGRLLAVAAYGLALPFEDRLFAARLLAVIAGAFTLVGVMLIAHRLFGALAARTAGFLYLVSPFALTYDRLALSDGFLSAFVTGLMLTTLAIIEQPASWRLRIRFGVLLALAVASKVSALLFLLALPLGILALAGERRDALASMGKGALIGAIGAAPMLWLFAANSGEIAAQHVTDLSAAGSVLMTTLRDMSDWGLSYFTIPVMVFAAFSAVFLRDGRALWLAGSAVLPFVLFALLSQPWSARYILPTLPPLLILLSGGLVHLALRVAPTQRGLLAFALAALLSLQCLAFDRHLLFAPAMAPFPADDRHQLVSGWPAGYGVREVAERLEREAATGPITAHVDTGGTRTLPTSLSILLKTQPSVRLVEGDFGSLDFRETMVVEARKGRTFAILGPRTSDLEFAAAMEGAVAQRIEVYTRPGGEWAATLFEIQVLR
jgi:4-amino-4-deoxy-L-arabinose transferase-like glycosyltransferase